MRSEEMIKLLPSGLREVLQKMNLDVAGLQEIRLRAEQPAVILSHGKEYVSQTVIHRRQLEETLAYLGNYSLYAYEEEIRRGYLSLPGGHRVGIAGRVVVEDGNIRTITAISSLNLRFAHQILGCADEVIPFLWQDGALQSTLIVSPPGKGKTTMLRDCIRQISNGTLIHPGMTVGLVDERSEIAGCSGGIPGNDVGIRTDVLDCCSKAEGMVMLLRSMAPQVIAVDEIGNYEDIRAIEMTLNSGCKLLATVHGSSIDEIRKKPLLERLIKEHVFERYIILQKETAGKIGKVREIYDERGTCLYQRQRSVC